MDRQSQRTIDVSFLPLLSPLTTRKDCGNSSAMKTGAKSSSAGSVVPHQRTTPDCGSDNLTRIVFPLTVPAGGRRLLEVRRKTEVPPVAPEVSVDDLRFARPPSA
jgi:hypothetical protein